MFANILDLFNKGGYVMYPIVLCSILSLAVTVERLLFYRQCNTNKDLLKKTEELLSAGKNSEAQELLLEGKGDCAEIGTYYLGKPEVDLNKLETKAQLMIDSYDEYLVFLNIVVTIAPLLGLLGTILGMISSFKVFDLRAGQPFAITAGIGEALIATAFGLTVAIFALVLYGFLKYQAGKLSKKLMQWCAILESAERNGE